MWIWLTIGSALILGFYDVAKKQSLKRNSAINVLLLSTAFSALFLSPFLSEGSLPDHLHILLKAVLVTTSWISGMTGMKLLPLTVASPIKASRPVFVLLFSILIFGERLNALQWTGSIIVIAALFMLSFSSRKEGINFTHNKGIACMALSVLSGVASALYDKHIIAFLDPLFVQSWGNLYIMALMALVVLVANLSGIDSIRSFKWDWSILAIAVLITVSDACYFFALKDEDALISVISMVRRCSVVVAFACGALLFKEHNIRSKAIDLVVLLAGMAFIVFGSC